MALDKNLGGLQPRKVMGGSEKSRMTRYLLILLISGSFTHGGRYLTTLLVKHYNDLLDRQVSGRGREEVTYFYVGEVFCK